MVKYMERTYGGGSRSVQAQGTLTPGPKGKGDRCVLLEPHSGLREERPSYRSCSSRGIQPQAEPQKAGQSTGEGED